MKADTGKNAQNCMIYQHTIWKHHFHRFKVLTFGKYYVMKIRNEWMDCQNAHCTSNYYGKKFHQSCTYQWCLKFSVIRKFILGVEKKFEAYIQSRLSPKNIFGWAPHRMLRNDFGID